MGQQPFGVAEHDPADAQPAQGPKQHHAAEQRRHRRPSRGHRQPGPGQDGQHRDPRARRPAGPDSGRHNAITRSSALTPRPAPAGPERPSSTMRRPANDHGGAGMAGQHHRAPGRQAAEAVEHVGFGGRVEMRGGFIEQQQRRVADEGASDGNALRLAPGQAVTALADDRVQPCGSVRDQRVQPGRLRRRLDLLIRRVVASEADVLPDDPANSTGAGRSRPSCARAPRR